MKKPADLRDHLTQWVPELARHPEKLSLFIERGHVATKLGSTASYQYHYTLQLLITEWAEPTDVLIVPLILWLHNQQPDLLQDPAKRDKILNLEAEILNNNSIDLALKLDLTERVLVRPAANGGYECEHLSEPALPDLSGPTGWQIYLKGELIADGPVE